MPAYGNKKAKIEVGLGAHSIKNNCSINQINGKILR